MHGADAGFVDTHVHFWDHSVDGLRWAWLEPGFDHPRVRSLSELDAPRYATPEFRSEVDGAGVTKVVHVQAASWGPHPVRETAWLQALGDEHGWPDAIIGNCRIVAEDAPALIEQHAAFSRYRGVRDLSVAGHLEDPRFAANLRRLAESNGLFELMVSFEHFEAAAAAARTAPDVTVVVEHAGLPVERTEEYRSRWLPALHRLAEVPSTVCKISALAGGADPGWTVDSLRPWVEGCIEAFGVERCMFGSNWPVDKPYGAYGRLVEAYRSIIQGFGAEERRRLLEGTAEHVYGI